MKVSFIRSSYQRFFQRHKKELLKAIEKCLSQGNLILGDEVEKFEKTLAKYVGTKYAVGLNSGTDALILAIQALGIQNKTIVTSGHTFWATIEAILQTQNKVKFADIDPFTGLLDMKVWDKTGYLIPVHIAGQVCEFRDNVIIDDACQAMGAIKNPTSDVQAWSFYPAKILGAFGDSGAITTNNKEVYEKILNLRNHGGKPHPTGVGYNSRLDNLQAAILNIKFKYLPYFIKRRQQIAKQYDSGLKNLRLTLPVKRKVYQDYIILTSLRNELQSFLTTNGVETLKDEYPFPVTFAKPLHAKNWETMALRLPCSPELTNSEIQYVIKKIKEFYDRK